MATTFFLITIGLVFSFIAAIMAFLITYHEYSRHFLDKRPALKISVEFALVIFTVFIVIAIIVGFLLPHMLS